MTTKELFDRLNDEILKAVVDYEMQLLEDGGRALTGLKWSGIMGIQRPAPTAEWPEIVYEDVLDADTIEG